MVHQAEDGLVADRVDGAEEARDLLFPQNFPSEWGFLSASRRRSWRPGWRRGGPRRYHGERSHGKSRTRRMKAEVFEPEATGFLASVLGSTPMCSAACFCERPNAVRCRTNSSANPFAGM